MSYEKSIWRLASRVSAVAALIAIVACALIFGINGFWGAVLGSCVVVIFFAIHLGVSIIARNLDPLSTLSLVMFSYFAKVMALAGFLIVFRRAGFVDQNAFGISAIFVTAAWLAGEVRAFVKLRLILTDGKSQ